MLSRRSFVAAGASGIAMLGASRRGLAQGIVTRRPISALRANDPDLVAMRDAVAAMKDLPRSDPRNWIRFADVHRNFCPHANWYFLPWHRAYIAAFESIVRELAGRPDFALPYWDWSVERRLPTAFASGTPASNPLNHVRPGMTRGDELPDDMVGGDVVARILASPDFEAFGSTRPRRQRGADRRWQRRPGTRTELEFNPHDGVHTTVGGDMAQPDLASRDPVFFMHHANVDRLWAIWNRRGNPNAAERNWLDFRFDRQFPNPDGSWWNVSVEELEAPEALGYRYDGEVLGSRGRAADSFAADPVLAAPQAPAAAPSGGGREVLLEYRRMPDDTLPRVVRDLRRITTPTGRTFYMAAGENDRAGARGRPVSVSVPFGRPLAEVVQRTSVTRQRIWAVIRDIEPPSDNTTRVRVFVNCGDLSPATPVTDASYVTTLSFFAGGHAGHESGQENETGRHRHHWLRHHAHDGAPAQADDRAGAPMGTCACVDLGPALSRMSRTQPLVGDRIVLQLVPVGGRGAAASSAVTPRRVEVAII